MTEDKFLISTQIIKSPNNRINHSIRHPPPTYLSTTHHPPTHLPIHLPTHHHLPTCIPLPCKIFFSRRVWHFKWDLNGLEAAMLLCQVFTQQYTAIRHGKSTVRTIRVLLVIRALMSSDVFLCCPHF